MCIMSVKGLRITDYYTEYIIVVILVTNSRETSNDKKCNNECRYFRIHSLV